MRLLNTEHSAVVAEDRPKGRPLEARPRSAVYRCENVTLGTVFNLYIASPAANGGSNST